MKKLIVAALLIVGMTSFAQENDRMQKRERMEKLTPEQRDQLQLKKLTLDLNLSAEQQKEMARIIADRSAKREAMVTERKLQKDKGVTPTADDRFKKENERLDYQAAETAKLKKLLTEEQFTKWEKIKEDRKADLKNKGKRKGEKMPDPENGQK